MALSSGTRLGAYEIMTLLGAGGMGEVYKARDTRLDRSVAIKVLPASLASEPQFRERFDREARTISQLDHPHICTLYDVGEEDGTSYLVMQYLEGETLEQRLKKGAVPLEQALQYGVQIGDALDKAHRAGIVHRDLKPGNIMLTKSGATLLDFGLAKTTTGAGAAAELSMLPTTPPNLTAQGVILGTFQYMAPEQLEGKDADARTDIFAFGAVLYEMLAGTKAFRGQSQASLIAAIMHVDPPPVSSVQPVASPALSRIVETCLQKNPDDRWQTTRDLTRQLQWVAEHVIDTRAPVAGAPRRTVWIGAGAGLLIGGLVALVGAIWWARGFQKAAPSPSVRFSVPLPDTAAVWGASGTMAVSPDGLHLVFEAVTADGKRLLWLRSLHVAETKSLMGTEGALEPFWSPDSRFIAFFADRKLKMLELASGTVRTVCDASGTPGGGTWSPEGVIVFAPFLEGGLNRIPADGGTPIPLTTLDRARGESNHVWPHFLPDGRHYVFQLFGRDDSGLYLASLDSTDRKRLIGQQTIDNTAVAYAPPGFLVFVRNRTLWAQPFDAERLELTGEPVRLADGFSIGGPGRPHFSVSRTGVLAYRPEASPFTLQPTWVARDGRQLDTMGRPGSYGSFALSPDGRTLAIVRQNEAGADRAIWFMDVLRGTMTRFTTDVYSDIPLWSPSGDRLVVSSARDTPPNLFLKFVNGEEQRLFKLPLQAYASDWSQDGATVVYEARDAETKFDLWLLPISGDRKPISFLRTPANERDGRLSPDGMWIAFTSDTSGKDEVYLTSYPRPGRTWQVSTDGGSQPQWRRDGKELFFVSGRAVAVVDVKLGPVPDIGIPKRLFAMPDGSNSFVADADGQRFLVNVEISKRVQLPIQVVVNWTPPLKQ